MNRTRADDRTILCVVGARPNFMKIAPIMRVFKSTESRCQGCLVHTGQHYDDAMKGAFFRDLNIPLPDIDLGVGSGSHAWQTAEIMKSFEHHLLERSPSAVLVVGDVNSTIACALVAAKLHVPVFHVESGLRSFDRHMPEEINRVLTDQLSDLLFTTEPGAAFNLEREGIDPAKIHFVGNVMIDTLMDCLPRARPPAETLAFRASPVSAQDLDAGFVVATLHRPSNVDDPNVLSALIDTLVTISTDLPVVFPAHPRTLQRIRALPESLKKIESARVHLIEPLGYLEMLGLVRSAHTVLTDSGGLQEETTALGIPCLTLRQHTERPITVEEGTNTVTGTDPQMILRAWRNILSGRGKVGRVPPFWDGNASERIVSVIEQYFI